jgi:Trypsin-like peptidase domain
MYATSERPERVYGVKLLRYEGDVRFPDSGLGCVVYIGEAVGGRFQLRGTGFLVQVQRQDRPIYYIVTAHHVIRRMKKPNEFAIRLNDSGGRAKELRNKGFHRWWRHPTDDSVDAAVFPWGVGAAGYPFKLFQAERFVTQEIAASRMIGVGDEIYVVGLFRQRAGVSLITPIVRTGHIAMMANERTPTENYGDAFMHLIEAFSLKGMSGAPVFVHETVSVPIHEPSPHDPPFLCGIGNIYLLGLLHGILPVPVADELKGPIDPTQMWHTGISQVVPADQILDILNQPELLEYEQVSRKKLDEVRPVETAIEEDDGPISEPKPKNRDIPIPPIARKQFFTDLEKATQRRKPSS